MSVDKKTGIIRLTLTPREMYWRLYGASAQGRRTIDGHTYVLLNNGTHAEVRVAATVLRHKGISARILKNTTHYGDWELWVKSNK